MKRDIHRIYGVPAKKITIIYNGIDDKIYRPKPDPYVVASYGIDSSKPYVLLVCRITRQKGIMHFLNMIKYLMPEVQAVICADTPDTDELKQEVSEKIEQLKAKAVDKVFWIAQNVPLEHLISLYTHAAVFVCPSIYEPFGLINLEAMACETPVVASAVGGIPEVVQDGQTGLLVRFSPRSSRDPEPEKPAQFAGDLAKAVNGLITDPSTARDMGRCARKRVEQHFSWKAIAQKTADFYERVRHHYHEFNPSHPHK
jgi:glycosyltransferase involved in cell wall biosynthesis